MLSQQWFPSLWIMGSPDSMRSAQLFISRSISFAGSRMADYFRTIILPLLIVVVVVNDVSTVRYVPKWKKQVNHKKNVLMEWRLPMLTHSNRIGLRNPGHTKRTIPLHVWWQRRLEVSARQVVCNWLRFQLLFTRILFSVQVGKVICVMCPFVAEDVIPCKVCD